MAAAKKRIIKKLQIVIMLLPMFGALWWSVQPALVSLLAATTLKIQPISQDEWNDSSIEPEIRRQVQFHFLRYKIYIPMEDIFIKNQVSKLEKKRASLLMTKACGHANLYVWLPLKFRIPFLGAKFMEWCWKPIFDIQKKSDSV
ncbi:MAG: hypothetical protein R3B45_11590 [Bdellovibrionota bacterium]